MIVLLDNANIEIIKTFLRGEGVLVVNFKR